MAQRKYLLDERSIPTQWYNLSADIPGGPRVHRLPDGSEVKPEQMEAIFPPQVVEQEMSTERWIDIPVPVLDLLSMWRPTPLRRARSLEKALGTPARIWYKDESVSPAGSHKPNTAVAQVYYNKEAGIERLTTETGAGQWGSALSFACSQFGLTCKVFMVRVSYDQKPFRKTMMRVWGGDCVASPSQQTAIGRKILAETPDTPGSLGIAISEAVEAAVSDPEGKTRYSLGSVLNHVMLHQTVIGLEAKQQLREAGVKRPDVIIGCAGGGSNFAGIAFPFTADVINGEPIRIVPIEPAACPTLTRGAYVWDHGDCAAMTPLLAMHSLGHAWVPPPLHAGGLRYHGMSPLVSQAVAAGLMHPQSVMQTECFAAAVTWARSEGFIPAPETSHALAAVIREARLATEEGKQKDILFCYSGHGLMDLSSYEKYLDGALPASALDDTSLQQTMANVAATCARVE
jgi:tryptophan synthase beta chain